MWLGGTVIPIIPQSLKTSAKEYTESDSDLGDDEERILMHARWSTISQDNDVSTLKWGLNLSERAWHSSSRKARRKEWIKLYSSSFSPEEILHDKREDEDGEKQMGGNDYFFQIKNMEASESANSGKDHIDPEGLKRW